MAKDAKLKNVEDYEIDNSMSIKTQRVIAYIVLAIVSVLCLVWFVILVVNATKTHGQITGKFSFVPSTHLVENFINLKNGTIPIYSGLINSLIVATTSAVLCTYVSTMTAYAIHAYDFKLKKFIYTFILMVMMIPTQVTALGFIKLVRDMNLENNFAPLILPAMAAPVTFFYLKQYMESTLPLSLVEAARIDGSGEFRTFNQIILPLMKPAISVQAIFTFVSNWNNYFTPALVLTKSKMKTLPVLLAELRGADFLKFDMGQVYVMILFSILPVVVVYLILSKQIIGGQVAGAVKG